MPDFIRFPCPSCDSPLQLPLEAAGQSGNCPVCQREITAPDPRSGTPARLTASTAPPPYFAEPAPAPLPAVSLPPAVPPPRRFSPALLIPLFLLALMLGFLGGYLLGSRNSFDVPSPRVALPPAAPVEIEAPPRSSAPEPPPVPAEPAKIPVAPPEPSSEPTEETPPAGSSQTNAATTAETTLRAFLEAPDWTRRAAYVLDAARVRPLMEAHARDHGDAALSFTGVSLSSGHTDPSTGETLFVFLVSTAGHPGGFPVAVHEAAGGCLVDWETFVEFHDDRFKTFAAGPAGKSARFHLYVSRPPAERAAATDNEFFSSFLLDPPMPGRGQLAYVRKNTDIHTRLTAAIRDQSFATPVVEVAKRSTPDDKTYLEITGILADTWAPR